MKMITAQKKRIAKNDFKLESVCKKNGRRWFFSSSSSQKLSKEKKICVVVSKLKLATATIVYVKYIFYSVCTMYIYLLSFGLLQSLKQTESAIYTVCVCMSEITTTTTINTNQIIKKNTGSAISKTTIIVFKSVASMGNFFA